MIKLIARSSIREDSIDKAISLFEELVAKTREESGCIQYELCQDTSDATQLIILETWASQEALDAHMKSAHFTHIVPQVGALASKDMGVTFLKPIC